MLIEVTQEDIDYARGFPHSCNKNCIVATAIKKYVGKDVDISVGVDNCYLGENYYDLPEEVTEHIRNYCNCDVSVPFSFNLELPQ